jgi:large subunit ribosomal protein L18
LKHVSVQVIDDVSQRTLVSASTMESVVREGLSSTDNTEASKRVGEWIARRALEKGVSMVVFDRGGYLYHGRVKAVADAARAAGLQF